jgi:hypothetical protein
VRFGYLMFASLLQVYRLLPPLQVYRLFVAPLYISLPVVRAPFTSLPAIRPLPYKSTGCSGLSAIKSLPAVRVSIKFFWLIQTPFSQSTKSTGCANLSPTKVYRLCKFVTH